MKKDLIVLLSQKIDWSKMTGSDATKRSLKKTLGYMAKRSGRVADNSPRNIDAVDCYVSGAQNSKKYGPEGFIMVRGLGKNTCPALKQYVENLLTEN